MTYRNVQVVDDGMFSLLSGIEARADISSELLPYMGKQVVAINTFEPPTRITSYHCNPLTKKNKPLY